jgi:hypothetical protein
MLTPSTSPLLCPQLQQRRLAAALRLDYDGVSKTARWPTLLSRRILAFSVPGPSARPSMTARSGFLQLPGSAPPPTDASEPKRPRRSEAGKLTKSPAPWPRLGRERVEFRRVGFR